MKLRIELYRALSDLMGEPEFTKWFAETFRAKLAEVKGEQVGRCLTTGDLVDTESWLEVARQDVNRG
jgi:hypothetical protein